MSKHTPEPWTVGFMYSDDSLPGAYEIDLGAASSPEGSPARAWGENAETAAANAERIVACVNACAGLDPAGIPGLLDAALAVVEGWASHDLASMVRDLQAAIYKTRP